MILFFVLEVDKQKMARKTLGAPRAQTRAKGPAWALWTPILANRLENNNKQSAAET